MLGSTQQLRMFRRAAPYPSREDRTEELKDALDRYQLHVDIKLKESCSLSYDTTACRQSLQLMISNAVSGTVAIPLWM